VCHIVALGDDVCRTIFSMTPSLKVKSNILLHRIYYCSNVKQES
jgi:hypothetical protein